MHIWLKSEPLVSCAINYPISHHINANTLRKTVNYAKNKGTSGYPKIEYSIWKYIACNKINTPEQVAWMYFETFYFISNYGLLKNVELDTDLSNCKTQEEIGKLKDSKKVDLYQFILHLYIQQLYSIDLKSSFMSREEWPVNRNDGNDRRKSKTVDEINFMNFITKNFEEMISLFLPDKTLNQNELVSEEILQALNFILEGSIDNMQTILPFNVFIKQPIVQLKISEGKCYVKNLTTFLRNFLEINPFGLNSCLRTGKRIAPSYLGGSNDPRKTGKIITNQASAPSKYCVVKKCRKSLIFLGPTQRTLSVDSCVECSIVSVCRRLIIRNCSMCTFYTLTPSSPILLSGCDNIKFAPYNTSYINIEDDIKKSGLTFNLNYWDKPLILTQNQSLINGTHWSLLDPKDYNIFSIPIEHFPLNKNISANNYMNNMNDPCGKIPNDYEQQLNKKEKIIEENLNLIQSSGLKQEQRLILQKFIENSFKEILVNSGEQRQLDHLAIINNNILNQNTQTSNNNSLA